MSPIPSPDNQAALHALKAMIAGKNILAALEVFHQQAGEAFILALPGFKAYMLAGPETNRLMLVGARHRFQWRNPSDPVTTLLRHGLLVEDGEAHDSLRKAMLPPLHRAMLETYVQAMIRCTDQVIDAWQDDAELDFLVEMRRVALLIIVDTLFGADFTPDMAALWEPILKAIRYISPGLWMFWHGMPRPGYDKALKQLDDYLYSLVRARRGATEQGDDLIGVLLQAGYSDDLIRDQLITMLIAGHDTSTALLSWAFYLLAKHPDKLAKTDQEVTRVVGTDMPNLTHTTDLNYLDQVIKETLRMYPPIHLGSRLAATDIELPNGTIPVGSRVLYSIYLSHRDRRYWPEPDRFEPERFAVGTNHSPYQYLPFGGGPRNCIGRAFAEVESKLVMARILQKFALCLVDETMHPHMGATLEPRPGVMIRVKRKRSAF